MKILDCTLRDGGYCNNWVWNYNVPAQVVDALYPHVDIIEIGYRRPKKNGYEYCGDEFIRNIFEERHFNKIAIMIDIKDYMCGDMFSQEQLDIHFDEKKVSPIEYVRVACTINNLNAAIKATLVLKQKGYKTTINIMKATLLTTKQWQDIYNMMFDEIFNHLSYLYFADSFGSVFGNKLVAPEIMVSYRPVEVGIHPHNNTGMAFSYWKEADADIIDSSIAGLGRGAGNLDTIQVLMDRDGTLDRKLYECLKDIEKIKKKAQCGYCYEYHYCAKNNIHPNYAVYLKGLRKYGRFDIIKILGEIDNYKKISFDKRYMENIINE